MISEAFILVVDTEVIDHYSEQYELDLHAEDSEDDEDGT